MLPPLLWTLGFRCNITAYRPVMDALALLQKYADVDGKTRFYDATDAVPMGGVVRKDWREAVVDDKGRIEHIPYELCVLVALRDAIRRRFGAGSADLFEGLVSLAGQEGQTSAPAPGWGLGAQCLLRAGAAVLGGEEHLDHWGAVAVVLLLPPLETAVPARLGSWRSGCPSRW
jgi:hypothetical protein